jgi:hypothetical protein
MDIIEIQTLVDITNTRVVRANQGTREEFDQNRNFITLVQCVELRSIITYTAPPISKIIDITDWEFGTEYTGKHRIWTFTFIPDRIDVYNIDRRGPIGALLDDIDSVPIIKNLDETINIAKAIFDCSSIATKNTIIKAHPGTIYGTGIPYN